MDSRHKSISTAIKCMLQWGHGFSTMDRKEFLDKTTKDYDETRQSCPDVVIDQRIDGVGISKDENIA